MINKLFSLLGKFFLILLVIAGIIGMGVYLGIRLAGKYTPPPSVAPTSGPTVIVVTASPTPAITNTPIPTPTFTPTPTPIPPITVNGGIKASTYSLSALANWKITKEHDEMNGVDVVTLSRNNYVIGISQGAIGGTTCVYPGDPPADGPSALYKEPMVINAVDGRIYRRGLSDASTGDKNYYQLCEKRDFYFSPTTFGSIRYETPKKPDEGMLKEMDGIVSSIKSQ